MARRFRFETPTREVTTTEITSVDSITFMRAITLSLFVENIKPNTTLYVYFDGVDVSGYVYPAGGSLGDPIVSDSTGTADLVFELPGGTFTVGNKEIIVTDAFPLDDLIGLPGNLYGSAVATFSSIGTVETKQAVVNSQKPEEKTRRELRIETREERVRPSIRFRPISDNRLRDPLAQSFFTYGVDGGCFITSIDLYFQSKDPVIPVFVELREMVNGYPASTKQYDPDLIATVYADDVNVSEDASVATTFTFKAPVYLQQDKDYCFVVITNCTSYNLFTSMMGEASLETGVGIFEQPFVGSMFKSENQITWTAEQFQDIKFTMRIASFNTVTSASIDMVGSYPGKKIYGTQIATTNASQNIDVTTNIQHGLSTGDVIYIAGDTGAIYNGIDEADLTGQYGVTVDDEYHFSFTTGSATANTTGVITTGGVVRQLTIVNGGSNYVNPVITIDAPTSGTQATATAIVHNGVIVGATMTNIGNGYDAPPSVVVSDSGGGSGALITGSTDAVFTVYHNKRVHSVTPMVAYKEYKDTTTVTSLDIARPNYSIATFSDFNLNKPKALLQDLIVASRYNENTKMANAKSVRLNTSFSTTNPNVSPVLNTNTVPALGLYNIAINDPVNDYTENLTETNDADPAYNTELSAKDGTSYSRYVTRRVGLTTVSTGIRLLSDIYSTVDMSVEWYVRTSLSGENSIHTDLDWTLLECDVDRNKSAAPGQYFEYEFLKDDLPPFDTYDLKCVMRSVDHSVTPIVRRYRVIVLT